MSTGQNGNLGGAGPQQNAQPWGGLGGGAPMGGPMGGRMGGGGMQSPYGAMWGGNRSPFGGGNQWSPGQMMLDAYGRNRGVYQPPRTQPGVNNTTMQIPSPTAFPVPGYSNPLNGVTAPPGTMGGQSNLPPAPAAAPYAVPGFANPLNGLQAPPGTGGGQSNLPMSPVPAQPYAVPGFSNPLAGLAPPPGTMGGQSNLPPAPQAQAVPFSQTTQDILARLGWR